MLNGAIYKKKAETDVAIKALLPDIYCAVGWWQILAAKFKAVNNKKDPSQFACAQEFLTKAGELQADPIDALSVLGTYYIEEVKNYSKAKECIKKACEALKKQNKRIKDNGMLASLIHRFKHQATIVSLADKKGHFTVNMQQGTELLKNSTFIEVIERVYS